jgi:hypothetical protein
MVQAIFIVVPDSISRHELEKLVSILNENHKDFKLFGMQAAAELAEVQEQQAIGVPEELKHALVYIAGILPSTHTDAELVARYYTDERFRNAMSILMHNQHLLGEPRVVNALKDMHISKTKLQQLMSVYNDVILH